MASIELLVVGGGGGGGGGVRGTSCSGSGAGGQVYYNATLNAPYGTTTIVVGSAGVKGNGSDSGFGVSDGGSGGNSSFGSYTANGGQGGLYQRFVNGSQSGGNSGSYTGGVSYNPYWNGGAGAGATANGSNANNTAYAYYAVVPGGAGYTCSITGSSVEYGQGASGGAGGPGWSGSNNGQYGAGGPGGDGGNGNHGYDGVAGIVGAVIIRYKTSLFGTCTGGTKTTNGEYTIHTFNTAGTYTFVLNGVGGAFLNNFVN